MQKFSNVNELVNFLKPEYPAVYCTFHNEIIKNP